MAIVQLKSSKGSTDRFYEVSVKGKRVLTRYGNAGSSGTQKDKTFESIAAAKIEACKLIQKTKKRGFEVVEDSLRGTAPVLWTFKARKSALGLHVDKRGCWVGDEAGHVFALDHKTKVLAHYTLGEPVKALVADEHWIYAGADSGRVFDLSRSVPTVAYEVDSHEKVYWMVIHGGALCITDAAGQCTVFDHEGDRLWSRKGPNKEAWMIRADTTGVYHGTGWLYAPGQLTRYDWKGQRKWVQRTIGGVGFGWLEPKSVYVSTAKGVVHSYSKSGRLKALCLCDDVVFSCAASPGGERIYAGDIHGRLYAFDSEGRRLWRFDSGFGTPQSMQYFDQRIYIVTDRGLLVCIDVREAAVKRAAAGKRPKTKAVTAPKGSGKKIGGPLSAAKKGAKGVLLVCKKEGGRLHVFPASKGFNKRWRVQFPRDIREEGATFMVDALVVSKSGGFYRTTGEIRRVTRPR